MAEQKFLDRLFPTKYDFYGMLEKQARTNSTGVNALAGWLKNPSEAEPDALLQAVVQADGARVVMEEGLTQAFSTPFDRGDLYSISVGMDKVIEYAKSTLLSMEAYDVKADDVIVRMAENLRNGAAIFADAVAFLKTDLQKAERNISGIRETHTVIEELYRDGMRAAFQSDHAVEALKRREVYHHIKDASSYLEDAVDILHRIVVRLT